MNNRLYLKASEMCISLTPLGERVRSTLGTLLMNWFAFILCQSSEFTTKWMRPSQHSGNHWQQMTAIGGTCHVKALCHSSPALSGWTCGCTLAGLVAGDGLLILRHFILVCPFVLALSKPTFFLHYSFNCHCCWCTTVVRYLTYNMLCHAALLGEGVLWRFWRCN